MCKPSYIVCPDGRGGTIPSGCALVNGQIKQVGMPSAWSNPSPAQAIAAGYSVMNPTQVKQAIQAVGSNAGILAPQYQATDVPGSEVFSLSRLERPGGIKGGGITYTVTFTNNQALAVNTYRVFGDAPGTYAYAKGLAPVAGDTLVIGGTMGTTSLSHITARALARPFRISQIQFTDTTGATWFNSNPVSYFDTTPSPRSGMEEDTLQLSTLPGPTQFNSNIQIYDKSELFDGVNGLYIAVPAGEVIGMTFTIVSENRAKQMNLLN